MKMYINIRNVKKKENLDKVIEELERYKRRSSCCLDVGRYRTSIVKLKYLEHIFSERKMLM
jgi:hypothetical protein